MEGLLSMLIVALDQGWDWARRPLSLHTIILWAAITLRQGLRCECTVSFYLKLLSNLKVILYRLMRLSLVGRWVQGCRHSGLNLLDWRRYGYFNRAYHLGNSCLAFKELNLVSAESQCLLHLTVQVFQMYDDFVH